MSMTAFSAPAEQIRQNAIDAHATIRNKLNLTLDARKDQHIQAQAVAQQKMADLASNDESGAASNVKKWTATAFGTGDLTRGASPADAASIAITARDAGDRADQLVDEQSALSLLDRAETSGDETLCRAIAQRAQEMNWLTVLQTFMNDRPVQANAINQLRELNSTGIKQSAASLFQYALPTPPELGSLSPFQIQQLATEGDKNIQ